MGFLSVSPESSRGFRQPSGQGSGKSLRTSPIGLGGNFSLLMKMYLITHFAESDATFNVFLLLNLRKYLKYIFKCAIFTQIKLFKCTWSLLLKLFSSPLLNGRHKVPVKSMKTATKECCRANQRNNCIFHW